MNGLEVTDVRVWPIAKEKLKAGSKIRANCQITFNDCMYVKAKLWLGNDGLWVGSEGQYGKSKNKETGEIEDKWFDSWRTTNPELQQKLTEVVVKKYNEVTGNTTASSSVKKQKDDIPF